MSRMNVRARGLCLAFTLALLPTTDAIAQSTTSGGNPVGVKVKRSFRLRNNTGMAANDLHFKAWQKEDNIDVNGWEISADCFDSAASARAGQPAPASGQVANHPDGGPPTNDPDNGNHAIDVDFAGGTVPAGGSCRVTICFWLTHYNTVRKDDVEWTVDQNPQGGPPDDSVEVEDPKTNPPGGSGNPQAGGNGGPPNPNNLFRHPFVITNDDPVRSILVKNLCFLASTTDYADLDQVPFVGSVIVDFVLGPGESRTIDVLTPTPFLGNFIYAKWEFHDPSVGPEGVSLLSSEQLGHEVPDPSVGVPAMGGLGLAVLGLLLAGAGAATLGRRRAAEV